MKRIIPIILVTCLFIASCGPKGLNDTEFAQAAQKACSTLHTDSESLDKLDFSSRAAAYKQAADALLLLNLTDQSAPEGSKLRLGLAGLADSFDKFGRAISAATVKANLKAPVTILITEDGTVFAYSGKNMFDMQKLNLDTNLITGLKANQAQVTEAATSLKLQDCIVAW